LLQHVGVFLILLCNLVFLAAPANAMQPWSVTSAELQQLRLEQLTRSIDSMEGDSTTNAAPQ